jgi:hypothetical protein
VIDQSIVFFSTLYSVEHYFTVLMENSNSPERDGDERTGVLSEVHIGENCIEDETELHRFVSQFIIQYPPQGTIF